MAINRDTWTRFPAVSGADTTTGARTWTHDTFSGSPTIGVAVLIVIGGSGADVVSAVSYGGVAMTRTSFTADSVGEAGAVWMYYLGSGAPAGDQTVSVTRSGTGAMICLSLGYVSTSGATQSQVSSFGQAQGDQVDPTTNIDCGANPSQIVSVIFSGLAAVGSLSASDNGSGGSLFDSHDFGNQVAAFGQHTSGVTNVTGVQFVGYTAASDDVAMIVAGIAELSTTPSSPPKIPHRFRNGLIMRGRR